MNGRAKSNSTNSDQSSTETGLRDQNTDVPIPVIETLTQDSMEAKYIGIDEKLQLTGYNKSCQVNLLCEKPEESVANPQNNSLNAKMYQQLKSDKESLTAKYFKILVVVASYWIISILTVFVNKALLSSSTVNLEAPLFVTWFQCIVSAMICFIMNRLSRLFPRIVNFPEGSPFDWNTFKNVIPLSVLFTLMISSNNLCLKYVGVAFYYVGRSLTTVFNVILTYIFLREKTSPKCIFCCVIILIGFWLGVDQESLTESFSLTGTIFGVLGSLSLSMYSIYTKKVLPFVKQEVWLLSYYNNVYSIFLFIPLMLINGELSVVLNYGNWVQPWFWFVMLIGGICGFAIGFVTALQIKVTSPLTHNISGTAKACAQTVIATQWYNDIKSTLWWFSNIIVLLGSALYARVKQVEMSKKHQHNSHV